MLWPGVVMRCLPLPVKMPISGCLTVCCLPGVPFDGMAVTWLTFD